MADPRTISPPEKRRSHLSDLMRAKAKDVAGDGVNFCPFSDDMEHLDEFGYCDHLVGFTNDGKMFEPMIKDDRKRRVVRGELKPVSRNDVLVQITVSSRVYRDTTTPTKKATE